MLVTQKFPLSRTKIAVLCQCGRKSNILYGNLAKTKTCGKCSYKPINYWLDQSFGHLKLDTRQNLPVELPKNSHNKFCFVCTCSRSIYMKFQAVSSGNTKSCGKCTYQSQSTWINQKFGKLKLIQEENLPTEWGASSNKKFKFLCDCGNTHMAIFQNVTKGDTKSCGRCNQKNKKYWYRKRWGKLKLHDFNFPETLHPFSSKKFSFLCMCGKVKKIQFGHVTQGYQQSCGECNYFSTGYWGTLKWGNLSLIQGQKGEYPPMSNKKLQFICACGNKISARLADVNDGSTRSCGCQQIGQSEFSKESEVRNFVTLLSPDTLPACYPLLNSRRSYDVYVPAKKLAIEYHGLIWHSEKYKNPNKNDWEKYLLAKSRKDRLIQIYSDEWETKQSIIKAQIQEILSPTRKKRIKPTYEIFDKIPSDARAFLDQYHYLGAASGCLTVTAKYKGQIVGVWVFMKREEGTVLWHRACWDHQYKAWNPHEKALNLSIPKLKVRGFKRIITFSDNRFHTGNLYEKLGFDFEEEIKPNFSYTNGSRRVSKYAMRVKAGINEKSAAEAKGWYRIWDSGKRRYSFNFQNWPIPSI